MTTIAACLWLSCLASPIGGVRGRVVDDRGEPVRRFLVETRRDDDRRHEYSPPSRAKRRLAAHAFAGDGAFELPPLDAGDWVITVLGAGDTASAPQIVSATGTREPLQFMLPRPARLTGVVLDGNSAPVPDAAIFVAYPGEHLHALNDSSPSREPRTHTDLNGHFELDDLNPPRSAARRDGRGTR